MIRSSAGIDVKSGQMNKIWCKLYSQPLLLKRQPVYCEIPRGCQATNHDITQPRSHEEGRSPGNEIGCKVRWMVRWMSWVGLWGRCRENVLLRINYYNICFLLISKSSSSWEFHFLPFFSPPYVLLPSASSPRLVDLPAPPPLLPPLKHGELFFRSHFSSWMKILSLI